MIRYYLLIAALTLSAIPSLTRNADAAPAEGITFQAVTNNIIADNFNKETRAHYDIEKLARFWLSEGNETGAAFMFETAWRIRADHYETDFTDQYTHASLLNAYGDMHVLGLSNVTAIIKTLLEKTTPDLTAGKYWDEMLRHAAHAHRLACNFHPEEARIALATAERLITDKLAAGVTPKSPGRTMMQLVQARLFLDMETDTALITRLLNLVEADKKDDFVNEVQKTIANHDLPTLINDRRKEQATHYWHQEKRTFPGRDPADLSLLEDGDDMTEHAAFILTILRYEGRDTEMNRWFQQAMDQHFARLYLRKGAETYPDVYIFELVFLADRHLDKDAQNRIQGWPKLAYAFRTDPAEKATGLVDLIQIARRNSNAADICMFISDFIDLVSTLSDETIDDSFIGSPRATALHHFLRNLGDGLPADMVYRVLDAIPLDNPETIDMATSQRGHIAPDIKKDYCLNDFYKTLPAGTRLW